MDVNSGSVFSPVTEISSYGRAKGFHFWPHERDQEIRIDVKRDDLIHPYISGNKWRKLKYLITSAKKNAVEHIVTFGGAWSNHLLATACAGALYGFKTIGFVRGDEKVSNPVLTLCQLYGMQLIYVNREDYKDKFGLYQHFLELKEASADLYLFVDEGGYSNEAVKGCTEIIDELPQDYDHIFCACGTGTTLAGLARGLNERKQRRALPGKECNTTLHGVPVLAGGAFIDDQVRGLVPDADFVLHTDYHFGGYARTSPELLNFIQEFVSSTGILIEPVYTGKLFYAVFDLIKRQYFAPNSRILIIHTGGLSGFLGMEKKFSIPHLGLSRIPNTESGFK